MIFSTRNKGQITENIAEHWLNQQGLKTLEKNYHSKFGEIDLIMQDKQVLVFVEVRYRANTKYGTPAATIGLSKQRRIIQTAQSYLQRLDQQPACRFDVIALSAEPEMQINWITNAFDIGY